jgi:hypothetical protein
MLEFMAMKTTDLLLGPQLVSNDELHQVHHESSACGLEI